MEPIQETVKWRSSNESDTRQAERGREYGKERASFCASLSEQIVRSDLDVNLFVPLVVKRLLSHVEYSDWSWQIVKL